MSETDYLYCLDMAIYHQPLGFRYGDDVIGTMPEVRSLDQIRASLRDPFCDGPEQVYIIAMDVARMQDRHELKNRMLRFSVVACAMGQLGDEPIHSLGHIHLASQYNGEPPAELYEIWQGKAIIYMQESIRHEPGHCFAVIATPGEKVLVPLGWAHCVISASLDTPLSFSSWCGREYRVDYDAVRVNQGLAWYPLWQDNCIVWQHNMHYAPGRLHVVTPRQYREFGITSLPIYQQFIDHPARFQFISKPRKEAIQWDDFHP
ncbi:MAG: glucose-6-phosphate isomerase family protein [Kluyvera sp.]